MSRIIYVNSLNDLIKNIKTLESYLASTNPMLNDYGLTKIKGGHCFIVYKVNSHYHFSPSKFIGYHNNSKEKHEMDISNRDGRKTNPVISKIVKHKLFFDENLESEFINYCARIGVKPYKFKRTYWEPKNSKGENIVITI